MGGMATSGDDGNSLADRPRRPVLRESQNLDHLAEAVNNLQQGEFAWTVIPRCSAEGNSEDDNFL